ncbi:hypothetical protein A2956_04880 [Candidatus Roizmanbacteria bacterium RIFCSPLOWO2_01_FULL_37_57]|nr:MAG: hypothetical protein A3E10_04875 [Candidatus Roizmanbacteria bacterium RIFCSPHIGHO2_12_FULL_37_23]OGK43990.1 MAG: hypothetical protein A2956_04880 [Candidatus Roizmanbacteria bacterium RIFCSPLOWO2_01_FULL_37_57]
MRHLKFPLHKKAFHTIAIYYLIFVVNFLYGPFWSLAIAQESTSSAEIQGTSTSPTPVASPTQSVVLSPSTEPTLVSPSLSPKPTFNISDPDSTAVEPTTDILFPSSYPMLEDIPVPKTQKITKVHRLLKKSFHSNEQLEVIVEKDLSVSFFVQIIDDKGKTFTPQVSEEHTDDLTQLNVTPPLGLKPGKYTLKITDSQNHTFEQDFTWGVLAINTNKSIYLPNQTAKFSIAVLDNLGVMVCDAKVNLDIFDPDGNKTTLSTIDQSILTTPSCELKSYVEEPDYSAQYTVGNAGKYLMVLSAETSEGSYTISDGFEVRDYVPFDVERIAQTRIFPPETYKVEFSITAYEDFTGTIKEFVPKEFDVSPFEENPYSELIKFDNKTYENDESTPSYEVSYPFQGSYPVSLGFGETYDDQSLVERILNFGLKGHNGIDYEIPEGTPILSVDTGTVTKAGLGIYGNTVVVEHKWGETHYGHLSTILVKEGDIVEQNQEIALSGNTGISTGPHLHFSVKPNNADGNNGYKGMADPEVYLADSGNGRVLSASTATHQSVLWNVSIKKGDVITLGYKYKAPSISPEFYLLGPLQFFDTQIQEENPLDVLDINTQELDSVTMNEVDYNVPSNTASESSDTIPLVENDENLNSIESSDSANTDITHEATESAKIDEGPRDEIESENDFFDLVDSIITTNKLSNAHIVFEEVRLWQIAVDASNGMLVYAEDGANSQPPHYRDWSGSDLGNEASLQTQEASHGEENYVVLKSNTTTSSTERIYGALSDAGHLDIQVYSSGSWINGTNAPANGDFTTGIGTTNDVYRGYDIAYEQSSGEAIVVFEDTSTANMTLKYRVWNGSSWSSSDQTLDFSGISGAANITTLWVELKERPGSNNILLAFSGDTTNKDLYAYEWDGTNNVFQNGALIANNTMQSPATKHFDVAYESTSGEGLIAYDSTEVTGSKIYGATYTSGSWGSPAEVTDTDNSGRWLILEGDPSSNYIILGMQDSQTSNDFEIDMWNGSNWTTAADLIDTEQEAGIETFAAHSFGIVWEKSSSEALIAFADANATQISFLVYRKATDDYVCPESSNQAITDLDNAEGSSGPCDYTTVGWADDISNIQLVPSLIDDDIMLTAVNDVTSAMRPESLLWTGSSNSFSQTTNQSNFETDASPDAFNSPLAEPYMFAWNAPNPINITGTCDQYDEITDCTDSGAEEIKVAYDGVVQTTVDGTVDGSWQITGIQAPASGQVVTVFINSESTANERANAVTKYDGSGNITGVKLFQRHLTIGSDDTGVTVSNTNLSQYDNSVSGDADIFFEVDSNDDLNVDTSGAYSDEKLYLNGSDTYQPGTGNSSNVTTENFHSVSGATFDITGNTVYVDGTWNNAGTFSCNAGTVVFRSTADTDTITSGGQSFCNVRINNKLMAYHKLDEGTGTVSTDLSGEGNNGSATSGSTWTTGIQNSTYYGANPGGISVDATHDVNMGNISAVDFDQGDSFTVSFWYKTTNVAAMSIIAKQDTTANNRGWNVQTGGTCDRLFFQLASVYSGNKIEVTSPVDSSAPTSDYYCGGNWHHVVFTYDGTGTHDATKVALYFDGTSATLTDTTGGGTLNGTTLNGASFTLGSRDSSQQRMTGSLDEARVYKRILSSTEVSELYNGTHPTEGTYTLSDGLDVNGNLTVSTGSLDASSSNFGINVNGNYTNVANLTTRSSANITLDATSGTKTIRSDPAFNNLVINDGGGPTTFGVDYQRFLSNGSVTITGGTFTPNSTCWNSVCDITVGGNWSNSDTFTPSTGTVYFNKSSSTQTLNSGGTGTGKLFNNLTHSGAGTLQLITNTLDVDGNISNTTGTFDSNAQNITVAGNWTNDGIFNESTGTVTLDGTTSTTLDSGCADYDACTNENFANLILNKTDAADANDNVTLSSTHLRVTTTITITDGELVQGALNVRSEGTTAISVASGTKWTNISTGDLKLGGTLSNSGTVTFQGNGDTCGQNNDIQIRSTDTTQRSWNGGGTFDINDVDVDYQGGSANITAYSSTDGTHNDTNWTFSACPTYTAISQPQTIYQQGVAYSTGYSNQRKIVRDTYANLYTIYVDNNSDAYISYLSHDETMWQQYQTAIDTASTSVDLDIDSSGNLHIVYASTQESVIYKKISISLDNKNRVPSSGWTISSPVEILGATVSSVEPYPSIVIDSQNNRPAIVYNYDRTTSENVRFTRCKAGGACTSTTDWIGANDANTATGPLTDSIAGDINSNSFATIVQMPDATGTNTYDLAFMVYYTNISANTLNYAYATWDAANSKWSTWSTGSEDATISATAGEEYELSVSVDSSSNCNISDSVDGCVVVAYKDADEDVDVIVRNAGFNVNTSTYDPSSTTYDDISLSTSGGVYVLLGTNSSSDQLLYKRYSGSWTEYILDRGDVNDDHTIRYPSSLYNGTDSEVYVSYTKASSTYYRIAFSTVELPDTMNAGIQYDTDHSTIIATGGSTSNGASTNLFFDLWGSSPSKGDELTPKLEIQNTSTSFTDSVTHTGDEIQYDGEDPDDVRGTCVVYDDLNDQLVMWGGFQGNTSKANTNDAWALSLKEGQRSQWRKLTTSGSPPQANRAHVCVYDDLNDRLVVYGGWNGSTYLSSAYFLSLPSGGTPTWSLPSVNGSPPDSGQQLQSCAIYDSTNDRMIVYGGYNGADVDTEEVYELTLPAAGTPTWTQVIGLTPSTPSASGAGRDAASCAYDADSNRMIMYGGHINATTNEVWALDLTSGSEAWAQISPTGDAGIREGHSSVIQPDYSGTDDRMIIFGGNNGSYLSDVWQLVLPEAGGGTWTDKSPTEGDHRPQERGYGSQMGVYDPLNTRALFFGGYDGTYYSNTVISFDLPTSGLFEYKEVADIHYLRSRDSADLVYDTTNNQVVSFGGAGRGLPAYAYHLNEVWTLATASSTFAWKNITPDESPLVRELTAKVYDPINNQYVMCFGLNIQTVLNDCWGLSLDVSTTRPAWTFLNPSGTVPTARWGVMSTYDDLNDRMVIFGGKDQAGTKLQDVKFLSLPDGTTPAWSTPTTSGTPPSIRWGGTAIYDPGRDRMIIFGGTNDVSYYNDVYELTLPAAGNPTWTTLSPTGSAPTGRRGHVAVYDPDRGDGTARMVVFGGYNGTNQYNDVYELTLPGAGDGVWTDITPASQYTPEERRSVGGAYDEDNDRLVILGGRRTDETFFDDTWALSLGATESWTRLDPKIKIPLGVTVTGLTQGANYHWQAWVTGDIGDSTKTSYGSNEESATDFSISGAASATLDQLLKHGAWFSNGVEQPFTF